MSSGKYLSPLSDFSNKCAIAGGAELAIVVIAIIIILALNAGGMSRSTFNWTGGVAVALAGLFLLFGIVSVVKGRNLNSK